MVLKHNTDMAQTKLRPLPLSTRIKTFTQHLNFTLHRPLQASDHVQERRLTRSADTQHRGQTRHRDADILNIKSDHSLRRGGILDPHTAETNGRRNQHPFAVLQYSTRSRVVIPMDPELFA